MPASHLLLSSSFFLSLSLFFFISALPALISAEDTRPAACPSAPFTPRIVASPGDAQLKVLVPNITSGSFRQLVDCSDPSRIRGFCIDVFETALSILQANLSLASISYTCFNFSAIPNTAGETLTYNDMIASVANESYDVVVGDVTISAQRAYSVDFTQQYMDSGMVIITKTTQNNQITDWLFFGLPFTWRMWIVVVGAFASTGFILWLLEHESNRELTEGPFTERIEKTFWFIMEALVLLQRESIKSTSGQLIMVAWLFVVLLLTASYTAGLSSMLTATNLSPTTVDLLTIKASNNSIAYRKGSIIKDFLTTRFHVQESQLRPIRATADFIDNITKGPSSGGVIAIVDELPYANIMLENLSCEYAISGPQLTSEGFGFGFRHGLQDWVKGFSIALLNLTESGCLQALQNNTKLSVTNTCSSTTGPQYEKVSWRSLFPVFLVLVFIVCSCVITSYIYKVKTHIVANKRRVFLNEPSTSSHSDPQERSSDAEVEISTYY